MRKRTVAMVATLVLATVFAVVGTSPSSGHEAPAVLSVSSGPSAAFGPPDVDKGWKLAFGASFSGSSLNTSVWGTCYPWAAAGRCTNFGNNNEYEWYLPSQDRVSGGALHLVAQRLPTPGYNRNGASKKYFCRSGMVTTYPSFRFKYGYLQVVARVPFANELWSAFWLSAANQKWPPEIDILEHYGYNRASSLALHPTRGATQLAHATTPNISVGWHTFGLYWSRSSLIWYIDGREVTVTTQGIPRQSMYFIGDLADFKDPGSKLRVSKLPASNGCSGTLLIRSVKVWEPVA